ncbi:hypothetical protein FH972_025587 [Carpinus fangiana]|uniref:Uncharacterized protein n=1 Tax=Carpinus fangiana TaxID=176857 RepID=A0A5N6L1F9_9ROSI|nr:hypothetical protein FH972_025587 [Carpinus fangiana]
MRTRNGNHGKRSAKRAPGNNLPADSGDSLRRPAETCWRLGISPFAVEQTSRELSCDRAPAGCPCLARRSRKACLAGTAKGREGSKVSEAGCCLYTGQRQRRCGHHVSWPNKRASTILQAAPCTCARAWPDEADQFATDELVFVYMECSRDCLTAPPVPPPPERHVRGASASGGKSAAAAARTCAENGKRHSSRRRRPSLSVHRRLALHVISRSPPCNRDPLHLIISPCSRQRPAFKAPLDPEEQPIFDKLYTVRDRLLLMKSDKSNYVKSQDVQECYSQVIAQVEALNLIRTSKRTEQNQVDRILDDSFQLVSLFFMTIGRNAEAPAAYSLVSTIKRLLDHLREAGFFAAQDLTGLNARLGKIEESVRRGQANHSQALLTLLDARIETCRITLKDCQGLLSHLTPELNTTHTKLVSILRSLSGLNAKSKFDAKGLKDLQAQLVEIEKSMPGDPLDLDRTLSPTAAMDRYAEKVKEFQRSFPTDITGQDVVKDLLERCILWSDIVADRKGQLEDRFVDKFNELKSIRDQLEKLSLTQAWSLRETDLYSFQRRLDRIDESRVDALLPVYNQLLTLKKCLQEVKRSGGVGSPRELYPYSMKLNSIDNMRQDGKFVINGDIPEGQGSVTELLSECFELAYDLRNDAEGNQPDSSRDVTDDEGDEPENESDSKLRESIASGVKGLSIAQGV